MRAHTAGAFLLGFAAGFLCLGAVLWATGSIKTSSALATAAAPAPVAPPPVTAAGPAPAAPAPAVSSTPPGWQQPMQHAPVDVKALAAEAAKMPGPAVEPPPPLLSGGEADRSIPDPAGPKPPHLAMPIAGLDARKLVDSFQDKRGGRRHEALDIPEPRGTPVLAVAQGNVAKLFTSKDGGITVYQFDDTGTFCYYYAHLDRYAPGLVQGTLLRKGEVLGYVGTTGNAPPNLPHLHFAVFRLNADKKWWQGTAIDPLPLLR